MRSGPDSPSLGRSRCKLRPRSSPDDSPHAAGSGSTPLGVVQPPVRDTEVRQSPLEVRDQLTLAPSGGLLGLRRSTSVHVSTFDTWRCVPRFPPSSPAGRALSSPRRKAAAVSLGPRPRRATPRARLQVPFARPTGPGKRNRGRAAGEGRSAMKAQAGEVVDWCAEPNAPPTPVRRPVLSRDL